MESVVERGAMHAKQKTSARNVSTSIFSFLEKQFCNIFGMRVFCFFPYLLLSLSLPSEFSLLINCLAVTVQLIGFQRHDDNSICSLHFPIQFCRSAEMDESCVSDENSVFN